MQAAVLHCVVFPLLPKYSCGNFFIFLSPVKRNSFGIFFYISCRPNLLDAWISEFRSRYVKKKSFNFKAKCRSDPWTVLAISEYGHLQNSGGLNGIRTHNLCDAGSRLQQPSYEATQLGVGQFCCAHFVDMEEFGEWKKCIYFKCGLVERCTA